MKRLLLSLTAALACLAPNTQAAISVTGPVGPLTFDALPTVADGWSTFSFAGAAGDLTDNAGIDASVNANINATAVTVVLGQSATLPPSQNGVARWNSVGLYLQTRPTAVGYLVLMATLQNDTAGPVTALTVEYDWDQKNNNPVNEQVPGHRAFWSLTGVPGSWTLIPEFSVFTTTSTAQHLTANLALGTWNNGSSLYLIWVDDNGAGSTTDPQEGAYTIDNFTIGNIVGGVDTVLSFVQNLNPVTVSESQTATLSVTVSGAGGKYHWFKQPSPTPIAGATGPTLIIPNAQAANAGTYYVTVTNSLTVLQSLHQLLTVNADLTSPTVVRAILSNDLITVLVSFSEPVTGDHSVNFGAEDFLNYNLYIDTLGDGVGVTDAIFQPGSKQTNVVLTLGGLATAGVNYKLDIQNVTDRAANLNPIVGSPALVSSIASLMTPAGQSWRFHEPAVAAPADWFTTGFNDSSWSNGLSVFDFSLTTPGRLTLPTSLEVVNYFLPMTNALEGAGGFSVTNRIPTYYFRSHFSFPGNPTLHPAGTFLRMRTVVDDGVVIYLNGQIAFRSRCPVTNEPFANYGGDTTGGNGTYEGPFLLPITNLHSGDNAIAVLLKQGNLISSDITMGLELEAIIPVLVPALSLTIASDGSGGVIISWTDSTAQLKSSISLPNPAPNWTPVAAAPLGSTSLPIPVGSLATQRFYRLEK